MLLADRLVARSPMEGDVKGTRPVRSPIYCGGAQRHAHGWVWCLLADRASRRPLRDAQNDYVDSGALDSQGDGAMTTAPPRGLASGSSPTTADETPVPR